MNIAIIIPTYNEESNLPLLITHIFYHIPQTWIVIVDDSSTNKTKQVVKNIKKKYKNITLLSRAKKQGRGSAVLHGFSWAIKNTKASFFVEMDADFSHNPREISLLVNETSEYIVAVSSRYIKRSHIINWPLYRRILSALSNYVIRIFFQFTLHDVSNGFRSYSRKAVMQLLKYDFISSGFINLTECAYLLKHSGFTFKEIPGTFVNRAQGKSNATLHEFISSLIALDKIKRKIDNAT